MGQSPCVPEQWSQSDSDLSPACSVTKCASPSIFLVSQNKVDLNTAANKTPNRTKQAWAQTTAVSTAAAAVPLHLTVSCKAASGVRFGCTSLPAAPPSAPTAVPTISPNSEEAQHLTLVWLAMLICKEPQERLCFWTKFFHRYMEEVQHFPLQTLTVAAVVF